MYELTRSGRGLELTMKYYILYDFEFFLHLKKDPLFNLKIFINLSSWQSF